jgi:hypothetical protein
MKRLFGLFLVMLIVAVGIAVYGGEGKLMRVAGTATTPGNNFKMAVDSTDSFHVDTINSDVIDISNINDPASGYSQYNYALITLIIDTIIKCDSCNDSMIPTAEVWTSDDAGYSLKLTSANFTTHSLARDTLRYRFYLNSAGSGVVNKDSTLLDKIWIRTIISDSVVTNKTVKYNYFYARYYAWFCK